MSNKLKPCAHCGKKAYVCHITQENHLAPFFVKCNECGMHTTNKRTEKEAIAVWNRRVKQGRNNDE